MVIQKRIAGFVASISISWTTAAVSLAGISSVLIPTPAQAARCSLTAGGTYACSMVATTQPYKYNLGGSCVGGTTTRSVTYQVPEGTAPAGGWPVVFYFHGTNLATPPPADGPTTFGPADPANDSPGARHLAAALHELLDDPGNTGKKYAVVMPQAALQLLVTRFWDSNLPVAYNLTSDFCFFPSLWSSIESGDYGAASQYNMDRRFAFGMSSGGYNTSRMAVSWNSDNVWKGLAIHSASYASCLGATCNIPATLPTNHPPTKFFHGTADTVVPISTMYPYYDKLIAQNRIAAVRTNAGGHNISADIVGNNGVKAWFDQY